MLFISLFVALLLPLLFLYILWTLELYAASNIRLLIGATVYGGAAFGLSWGLQSLFLRLGWLNFEQVSLFSAPLIEEGLKIGLLVWLAARMRLRYAADGAAYGFAVGIGFALAENLLYLFSTPEASISTALARVLSVNLVHAFVMAVTGAILGSRIYLATRAQHAGVSAGYVFAIVIHATFNALAESLTGITLLLAGAGIGLGCLLLLIYLLHRATQAEGRQIQRHLQHVASSGESAAAAHPQDVIRILQQHYTTLEPERADLIGEYIHLQAQRGMLHKTIALNQRQKFDANLQRDLDLVEKRLESLKSAMGLYTWAWLRTVLPSAESDLWLQLESDLHQEQPILNLVMQLNQRKTVIHADDLQKRLETLRLVEMFADLSLDDLEDLALLLDCYSFSVAETIIWQDEISEKLYIVGKGDLIASVTDDEGAETILTTYIEGQTFNELNMLGGQSTTATVTTLTQSIIYTLSRPDLVTLIYAQPHIAMVMMRQFAADLQRQTELLKWVRKTSTNSNS